MPLELEDLGRIVNTTGAIVVLIWLATRRIKHNELYASGLRNDIWLMGFFWTLALLVGSLEQLFDSTSDARIVFASAGLGFTFKLLWRHNKNWTGLGGDTHGDSATTEPSHRQGPPQ